MLQPLLDDARHGVRILTKAPGLALTAALLIALVIGGNTTIYSMVNGVVRRPAAGVTATDLVSFGLVGRPGAPYFRYGDYEHYATQSTSLRSLAAWGFSRAAVETPGGTYLLQVTPTTGNYFETIGVGPALGRLFAEDEDRDGAALVAVITDAIWRTHFGGRADVIGRTMAINGRPATIIGITPPRFAGPSGGEWSDVWVSLHAYQGVDPSSGIAMIGRLAPGASIARARAEIETLQARLEPLASPEQRSPVLVTKYSAMSGSVIHGYQREVLAIFSIVTLLTLLVVCANVANLMLTRAVIRQRETAVRQSLGASRWRLVRLLLFEGLAIAAVACAAAFVLAWWSAWFVPSLLPQGPVTMPLDFTPDWRVALYAAILALIGTFMFSLVPGLWTWRQDPLPLLKDGAHTTARGRSRASNALVVLQLTFSVLLLTAAGLAYRSGSLITADVGFDTSNMLLIRVGTGAAVRSEAENDVLLERVRERLAALPQARDVAYTRTFWMSDPVRTADSRQTVEARTNVVSPEYLATLGLAPVSGRMLSPADRQRGGSAAVINQHLAQQLFPGANPLGQTLLIGRDVRPVDIVGIAPDAYYTGAGGGRADTPSYVFLSGEPSRGETAFGNPNGIPPTTFHVRYTGSLEQISSAVPAVLREVDSRLALASRETLASQIEERGLSARMISLLLGIFAAMSLLIAAVGQYAVVAFSMRRRARDFGVRLALGASARQIVGSVLREGAALTAIGLAAGLLLSVGLATLLRGALFGVTPTDPPTYGGVFLVLAFVSLFACYLPARRASRIDPVRALRQE